MALDRDVSEAVELRVAGQRMGEGRLGSRAGKWALRPVSYTHLPDLRQGPEDGDLRRKWSG